MIAYNDAVPLLLGNHEVPRPAASYHPLPGISFSFASMDGRMTAEPQKEIVVSAEEATFWMDRRGNWCNRHGRIEHKKIMAYFHAAIGRDENGYFVSQVNGDVREKVYFRYEDTALFVVEVIVAEAISLVLNTGRRMTLDPAALFIRHDALYTRRGDERIKFSEASMLTLSRYFVYEGEQCCFCFQGQRFPIATDGAALGVAKIDGHPPLSGDSTSETPDNPARHR